MFSVTSKYIFVDTSLTFLQVTVVRGFFCSLCAGVDVTFHGTDLFAIPKNKASILFWRCVFGAITTIFQVLSMQLLPMSLSVVLYWTQPIAAMVISWAFNGEKLSGFEVFSVGAAMLGVVMLSSPNLLSGGSVSDAIDFEHYPKFYLGVIVSLTGSVMSGFAWLMVKRLGDSLNSSQILVFFGSLVTLIQFNTQLAVG